MSKYKLGDITNATYTNDWSRVPHAPAVGAWLLTAGATTSITVATAILGGGYMTAAVIYAVGYIATTLVTSALVKALTPKPPSRSSESGGLLVNSRSALAAAEVVYGQVRKGGSVTFLESTGENNKVLHQIIVLAAHEVQEIGDIYLNDDIVTMSNENVTSKPYNGHVKIYKHLGNQTSADTAFANSTSTLKNTLMSETSVAETFIGKDTAYLYCRFVYDQDAFVNGLPTVTAVVKGKKIVKTINGVEQSAAYTSNAAWVLRDFLTSSYGLGDDHIDYATFEAAADVCADTSVLSDGSAQYQINGVVGLDEGIGDVLTDMVAACGGSLFWGGGYWKLFAGEFITPTKTLTMDDLRSNITLQTKTSMRDNFNRVSGTFIHGGKQEDGGGDWISTDYPLVKPTSLPDVFLAEDNGVETTMDLPLPYTTNKYAAQRLAKLMLYRGREQMALSADFGLEALDVEVGDFIKFRNERYGWGLGNEKVFEVIGWRLNPDPDNGDIRVSLNLRESSEAAFGFTAEDEREIINNDSTLLKFYEVPSVSLTLGTEYRVVNENVVNVLSASIASPDIERVDSVSVKYKKSTDTVYKNMGQAALINEGNDVGRFEVVGIDVPNISDDPAIITYEVIATPINSFGYRGTPVSRSIDVGPDTTPPVCSEWYPASVKLNHRISSGTAFFSWPPVGDLDLSHYRLYYNPDLNSNFTDTTTSLEIERIARPATSITIPATAGKFFLTAVDKTGNESSVNTLSGTNTRYITDTILNSELPALGNTVSHQEDSSFSGSPKTNITVSSGELFLTSYTASGSSGTYSFYHLGNNYFDVGSVRTVRTSYSITKSRIHQDADVNGEILWDAIPNNWDSWPVDFDDLTDETSNFGDTPIYIEVRGATTVAGLSSATWASANSEVVGRYIQFRARLTNTSPKVSPVITALTATVEY